MSSAEFWEVWRHDTAHRETEGEQQWALFASHEGAQHFARRLERESREAGQVGVWFEVRKVRP